MRRILSVAAMVFAIALPLLAQTKPYNVAFDLYDGKYSNGYNSMDKQYNRH